MRSQVFVLVCCAVAMSWSSYVYLTCSNVSTSTGVTTEGVEKSEQWENRALRAEMKADRERGQLRDKEEDRQEKEEWGKRQQEMKARDEQRQKRRAEREKILAEENERIRRETEAEISFSMMARGKAGMMQRAGLVVSILTTEKQHLNRVQIATKTYLGDYVSLFGRNVWFISDAPGGSTGIVSSQCKNDAAHGLCCKSAFAYNHMWNTQQPGQRWFLRVMDDTYMQMDNLVEYVSHLNPNAELFIGSYALDRPRDRRRIWAQGGAGWLLSKPALQKLVFFLNNSTNWYQRCSSDDVHFSKFLRKNLGIPLTGDVRFENSGVRVVPSTHEHCQTQVAKMFPRTHPLTFQFGHSWLKTPGADMTSEAENVTKFFANIPRDGFYKGHWISHYPAINPQHPETMFLCAGSFQ